MGKNGYFITLDDKYKSFNEWLEEHDTKVRADALNIDMEKPMHFTDEQKAWVKNYIIINAKRQRKDAIDEFANMFIEEGKKIKYLRHLWIESTCKKIAEQLKEQ